MTDDTTILMLIRAPAPLKSTYARFVKALGRAYRITVLDHREVIAGQRLHDLIREPRHANAANGPDDR